MGDNVNVGGGVRPISRHNADIAISSKLDTSLFILSVNNPVLSIKCTTSNKAGLPKSHVAVSFSAVSRWRVTSTPTFSLKIDGMWWANACFFASPWNGAQSDIGHNVLLARPDLFTALTEVSGVVTTCEILASMRIWSIWTRRCWEVLAV